MSDRVLDAVVAAAADATDATVARLFARADDGLRLAASLDDEPTAAPSEAAGYVLASGQPLALSQGAESLLCVPCPWQDGVVGALELRGKRDGGSFSYEDLELTTLLAGIAGAALGPP